MLTDLGRHDEALAEGRRAVELDPLSPVINYVLGLTLMSAGQTEAAIEQFNRAVELDSTFPGSYVALWSAWARQGRFAEAAAALRRGGELYSRDLEEFASLLARLPQVRTADAAALLARSGFREHLGLEYLMAEVAMHADDPGGAIEWLERAYETRQQFMLMLLQDPVFEPLHPMPRFQALLQKVASPDRTPR